jgi:hypothetical protein
MRLWGRVFAKKNTLDIELAKKQAQAELNATQSLADMTNSYIDDRDKQVKKAIQEQKDFLGDKDEKQIHTTHTTK